MLAAAKPATPMRLQKIPIGRCGRVGGVLGELGGGEAGAGEGVDEIGGMRLQLARWVAVTRLADRLARALTTPGTAASAVSTLRMQPPQCMLATASVVGRHRLARTASRERSDAAVSLDAAAQGLSHRRLRAR